MRLAAGDTADWTALCTMAGKVYGTTAWKNSDPDSSLPLVHCASAQGLAVNVLLLLPLTGVRFYQLFCGYWFLIRPKTIVFGRTYVLLWFFFFFFSPRNLRAPSADRCEILHDACCCVQFYNPGPKFWGSLPKKFLGAKICSSEKSAFGGYKLTSRSPRLLDRSSPDLFRLTREESLSNE